jgi:hypothetical protein
MAKQNFDIKKLLDYIPLAILIVLAGILFIKLITGEAHLSWRHIAGGFLLGITIFLFTRNHRIAVLALGGTLLLGTVSFISFSYPITTTTWFIGIAVNKPT